MKQGEPLNIELGFKDGFTVNSKCSLLGMTLQENGILVVPVYLSRNLSEQLSEFLKLVLDSGGIENVKYIHVEE
jgi:hypothetical protein